MIERHQDYLLSIPSLPAGGRNQIPLKLDTDAPFALRLVRSRNIDLNGWRFTTPSGAYQSSALRTDWIVPATAGASAYPSRGSIIYDELIYPPGSTINVDIGNATGEAITNAELLFRGSKLFQSGSMMVYTYPERMAVLPATYQVIVPNVTTTASIRNNQLTIKNDADMVIRCGACDAFTMSANPLDSAYQFTNVYVSLRDEQYKAYSNAPIHVNDLFGSGLPFPYPGEDDQMLFTPGLYTPEIYLPRRHNMYFDVFRTDDGRQATVDLYFRFIGMKVFQR